MDMNLGETHFNLLQVVNGLVSDMASHIQLCKSLLHPLRQDGYAFGSQLDTGPKVMVIQTSRPNAHVLRGDSWIPP